MKNKIVILAFDIAIGKIAARDFLMSKQVESVEVVKIESEQSKNLTFETGVQPLIIRPIERIELPEYTEKNFPRNKYLDKPLRNYKK